MGKLAVTIPVTVAVVDDDEAILDAMQLVLEDQRWDIRTYSTGEAFLADLCDLNPVCVVLDPHLPGVSGAEVARSVASAGIPIIGLTAHPGSVLASQVVDSGAWAMLTKPVTCDQLVECIRAAVDHSFA